MLDLPCCLHCICTATQLLRETTEKIQKLAKLNYVQHNTMNVGIWLMLILTLWIFCATADFCTVPNALLPTLLCADQPLLPSYCVCPPNTPLHNVTLSPSCYYWILGSRSKELIQEVGSSRILPTCSPLDYNSIWSHLPPRGVWALMAN